ncbi:TPA: sigma-54-dependent Fis family transcriptional regulator [Candidatus Poribacteria bacterium]|nr:sigma-54-dependent Fis family transcriptional regulator [Candidatus Poribacteria bacterium]HIO08561.1 sigma-54-dependent Fis family transcriptional regulator [Candidatus Poribacteria bacterium]HIO46442.1 sigma-54-dependent Fis family transcriptional regulator [Candidatus Poribacteria bacterium]
MTEHKILIADDDESIRFVLSKALEKEGYLPLPARDGKETIKLLELDPVSAVFLDIFMPDINGLDLIPEILEIQNSVSIVVITAHGDTQTAIESAKQGAYDYITKPFDIKEVAATAKRAVNATKQIKESQDFSDADSPKSQGSKIVGQSLEMRRVYQIIGRAATSNETVLVMGESGTGKELVARAIHQNSNRADQAFVVFDCSAIPANLIESALFGHVKGAFTGADSSRQGKFEQSNGGTIFLDEVGELSADTQMKLLRVLQEREVEPVGANQSRKIDVRVVAATNRQLQQDVKENAFREDLYYRLNVIPIHIPPLRDRKEDIPDLVDLFTTQFANEYKQLKVAISDQTCELLMNHSWPGNVRELENIIKQGLVMCSGTALLPEHCPQLLGEQFKFTTPVESDQEIHVRRIIKSKVESYLDSGVDDRSLYQHIRETMEKPLFEIVLIKAGGNRSKAAEILGINRNTLHVKIEEYGIEV